MKKTAFLVMLLFSLLQTWAQSRQIKGKVTDQATGLGIPDVSVVIKGTNNGTRTDVNGNFSLNVTGPGKVELEVSNIAYGTQSITADGTGDLNIVMDRQNKSLDEVVVVGYGTVKKRDLTGSVVSVKAEEIKKVPAANVMESLQGKLPGADITRANGSASSGVNITLRGNRSITANNGPLFIVDGIQYNSIQDINPNDIQSMEVLKDASSTAIYGSRGANGVIIVTTKKGVAGKTKVNLNSYYGITDVASNPRYMNAQEYIHAKRQANRKTEFNPTGTWTSEADDSKIFTATELASIQAGNDVDYIDPLLIQGSQQEHQIGVSSGTDKTKVYLSLNYFKEQGILRMDNLKRYSGRLNLDQTVAKWARVGMQMQYTWYDINRRTDPFNEASKIQPIANPLDADGKYVLFPNGLQFVNPKVDELPNAFTDNSKNSRFLGVAYLELTPFKGFNARSNFGLVGYNERNGIYWDSATLANRGAKPFAKYATGMGNEITWENILTYSRSISDHSFGITGVTTYLQKVREDQSAQGRGQIVPAQLYHAIGNNNDQISIFSGYRKENLISFTGRVNYSFKGKYLLSFSGRTDGSSKLSEGRKWDFFPSGAVAWRLSDESFMQNIRSLSDLKLRVSYGVTGSESIDAYQTNTLLTRIPFAYNDVAALTYALPGSIGNPALGWEKTAAFNVGLDFGFANNRITGTLDYYDTKTTDLLLDAALVPSSGYTRSLLNIGKTANKGIELGLNTTLIRQRDFSWNIGVNFFANKERIVDLVNGANDVANSWFIGHPVRVLYDYEKIGIWQVADSAQARLNGQRPGDIRVADLNGDKKITTDDRKVIGQLAPKWNGSLNMDFRFKNFDMNVFVFARMGQMMNYQYNTKFDLKGVENSAVHNYWSIDNQTGDYPMLRHTLTTQGLLYASTLGYEDASFVKIRNITLGYNLPNTLTSRWGMSGVRVYATGKNLFTFSKVKDYDPERGGSVGSPMTKLYLMGLNVDF